MASPLLFCAVGGTVLLLAARSRRPRGSHATRNKTAKVRGNRCVRRRRRRTRKDARRHRIEQLLERYVSDEPVPGRFYQAQPGDTLPDVAACALSTVGAHTRAQLLQYVYCIQSGPRWNVAKYATPSTTRVFGPELLVPGLGMGIRVAFLPRNEDALGKMLEEGVMPVMAVDPQTGAPLSDDDALGLIWLPPVSAENLEQGDVTCAPYSWSDGSSTIDPPPELLALLESRPWH